jgi:DNA-binding transcriptional ArsR family regulator
MSKARDRAVVEVFFALGDETRLSVVARLGGGVALSATALSDGAPVTRQAIVKHLRVLQEAGLVTQEKHGREVLYELESRRLDEAQAYLKGVSAGWDRAIARLRRMVEDPPNRTSQQSRPGKMPEGRSPLLGTSAPTSEREAPACGERPSCPLGGRTGTDGAAASGRRGSRAWRPRVGSRA